MVKTKTAKVRVGVVMGSRSDWETMKAASEILGRLGIGHEVEVVSAHRTPEETLPIVRQAFS